MNHIIFIHEYRILLIGDIVCPMNLGNVYNLHHFYIHYTLVYIYIILITHIPYTQDVLFYCDHKLSYWFEIWQAIRSTAIEAPVECQAIGKFPHQILAMREKQARDLYIGYIKVWPLGPRAQQITCLFNYTSYLAKRKQDHAIHKRTGQLHHCSIDGIRFILSSSK